jgi:hypothetical protein
MDSEVHKMLQLLAVEVQLMMAVAMMMFSTRLPSAATIASTKSGKTISKASKHDDLDVYRQVGRLFGNFYAAQRDTLQRHPGAGCFLLDYGDDESGLFMKYLRRGSGYYIDVGASELIQLAGGSVRRSVVTQMTRATCCVGLSNMCGTMLGKRKLSPASRTWASWSSHRRRLPDRM